MTARAGLRIAAAALAALLAACGSETAPTPEPRTVSGVVMKGAVEGATVRFFTMDAAGNPADPANPVATVTTGADGRFTAALPNQGVHLLAQTFDGAYADESDPATGSARRRITLPASPAVGFEAVLPPNAASFAITPYSNALLIKARLQAAGVNFFNVFDAVRAQATQAFGFDPITTVPADPLVASDTAAPAARQYALLLGAASQGINAIAAAAGRLPDFSDVTAFVNDLGSDGDFDLINLAEQVRRFRNNNFALYVGVALPVLDEALLSQPAVVPNEAPVAFNDALQVNEGGTATLLNGGVASVLDNDSDVEGSALTAVLATGPGHGTVTLNADGTFSYTHDGTENPDSFTYVANDGTDDSAPATVFVTVVAVNDPPVAVDDPGYTGSVGGTVTAIAGAGGVRDNDSDPDDVLTNLTVAPVSGPAFAASFTLSADGGFTYQHDGSANLVDSFTYEVCDDDVVAPACDQAVATITLSGAAAGDVVLPYLTNTGELRLFDPADPANPVLVDSGLPVATFTWRTLMKATVAGGVASNITPARMVYVDSDRTIKKVNLEPGQSRVPVQVSNIADACRINGVAEDFVNPDNSIVRVDTAGDNTVCEDGSGDDFTTAEAWLVPVATAAGAPGVGVGLGHCCGVTGIGTTSGTLAGVLLAEDDGAGGTFFLRRRNVGTLATPAFSIDLERSGSGSIYGALQRGLGDTHVYVRAVRFGVDTTYKILRFDVASNTLTAVYDYGFADGTLFSASFDEAVFDGANLYFAKADGSELLSVPHTASTTTQFTTLFTPSPGTKINAFEPVGNRIAIEASSADGTLGGVYSVLKAGGGQVPLAFNSASPSTTRLRGAVGALVLMDTTAGTAGPTYTASAATADGTGGTGPITDAQWAGETFEPACDFNSGCEESAAAAAVYLRRLASTTEAQIELADPATGNPTGTYVGSVFNVFAGPGAFVFGFGRYGQLTVFSSIEQTDLFLADSDQAAASPPATALLTVANSPGGDNFWLLFGDGEPAGGGGGATDSDFDGLTDAEEAALGTDPFNPDTDADGLTDGDEVNTYFVDPLNPDTDADGLTDGDEVLLYGTQPGDPDTDADGASDSLEIGAGSDPFASNAVFFADAACTASCDGSSWASGFNTQLDVVGAIDAALGAGAGVDAARSIFVLYAPGTFGGIALTDTPRTHVVLAGSLGEGVHQAAFPPTTLFDAQGTGPALRLANIVPFTAEGIAFTGGLNPQGGGVMLDVASTPVEAYLRRVQVFGNQADQGGGIALLAQPGTSDDYLDIQDSEIFTNSAVGSTSALGGGIYMAEGSLTLLRTKLFNNTAQTATGDGRGGGLYVEAAGLGVLIRDSEFAGNRANGLSGTGGGIHLAGSALTFADVQFTLLRNNEADSIEGPDPLLGGGGLNAQGDTRLFTFGLQFADNRAFGGPGGGMNASDLPDLTVYHSRFLANSSTRPGGGLHVHVGIGAPADLFNNLFVGNVATDPDADGAGVEVENIAGGTLRLDSNTAAYNQVTANIGGATPTGGGISVLSGDPADTFRNNIAWFNDDADTATPADGDNVFFDSAVTWGGNNVNDSGFAGNSFIEDPQFTEGFYLGPSGLSVDGGDDDFANVFTSTAGGPFTTDPSGAEDSGLVDVGFHYGGGKPSDGAATEAVADSTFVCSDVAGLVRFRPKFANANEGASGHLVVIVPGAGVIAATSLTTLKPLGEGSLLARDLGDGSYGIQAQGSGTADFDVYVDGALVGTVSLPASGCA